METDNINVSSANTAPNYRELISDIKQQLSQRKGLIVKRTTTFGLLPGIIIFAPLLILGLGLKSQIIPLNFLIKNNIVAENIWTWVILIIYAIIAALYLLTISHIIFIEKIVWVDSFFDKRNLSPQSSLKIAKKLFFPSYRIYLRIFARYYLFPFIFFYLGWIFSLFSFVSNKHCNEH